MEGRSKFFKREKEDDIDEEDKETDDIIEELSKIPKFVSKPPQGSFTAPGGNKLKQKRYEPIEWNKYFTNTALVDEVK
jgi:hypothetical protein